MTELPVVKFEAALTTQPDDPNPNFEDLSSRVLATGGNQVEINIGRQTELDQVEPSRATAVLLNNDDALTPGNPLSVYGSNWKAGRKVRFSETIDGEDIVLFTGYLEIPDTVIGLPGVDQTVPISAIDRMGRLDGDRPFASTLTEHILSQADDLVEYFPLSDPAAPFTSYLTGVTAKTVPIPAFRNGVPDEPDDFIHYADTAGPPGEDQSFARWSVNMYDLANQGGSGWVSDGAVQHEAPLSVLVGPGQKIAISIWLYGSALDPAAEANLSILPTPFFLGGATLGLEILDVRDDNFTAEAFTNADDVVLEATRRLEHEAWRLVTLRVSLSDGATDLWVGSDMAVSGVLPSPPSSATLTSLLLARDFAGAMAHLQVRVGADPMTYAQHIAQHSHGFRGLQRQTVAERIATLAGYAGVPAAEVALAAGASTPMQVAKLAGQNPAEAMRKAAATDGGILLTNPDGQIVIVPRQKRYAQPTAMSISYGWLNLGLKYRPDQPINDTTVTRTGGSATRRTNRASIDEHLLRAQPFEVDAAVDADAANLTAWTMRTYAEPRVRCPQLVINLRQERLTDADRKRLLALRVGDRITITDRPITAPADASDLVIQGIKHTISADERLITFNTSPLLGPSPGVPPVCATVGRSVVGAGTRIAY